MIHHKNADAHKLIQKPTYIFEKNYQIKVEQNDVVENGEMKMYISFLAPW